MTIKQEDIFQQDLSKANVVTLYLLPSLNVKLIPQLEKLKPGSRIVSHAFDMKGAKPKKVVQVQTKDGGEHTVYLWVAPWRRRRIRSRSDPPGPAKPDLIPSSPSPPGEGARRAG